MLGRARRLRAAFETEAMPHLDALYGTALRMTRNERDAEDLVQETLLRAFRFWHKYEQGSNCKAWLFKILSNTFVNRYHKVRREQEVALLAAVDDTATQELLSAEAAHAARDPEGALAARMLSSDVTRALEALPADFRLAVLLCDLEEFSYKEIADIMDCPVGTVMSRLYRGRRLLQRALHGYAVEQGIIRAAGPADHALPLRPAPPAPGGPHSDDPIDLSKYRRGRT